LPLPAVKQTSTALNTFPLCAGRANRSQKLRGTQMPAPPFPQPNSPRPCLPYRICGLLACYAGSLLEKTATRCQGSTLTKGQQDPTLTIEVIEQHRLTGPCGCEETREHLRRRERSQSVMPTL
jgi:hypothetical protein